jgi:hypothetical protein
LWCPWVHPSSPHEPGGVQARKSGCWMMAASFAVGPELARSRKRELPATGGSRETFGIGMPGKIGKNKCPSAGAMKMAFALLIVIVFCCSASPMLLPSFTTDCLMSNRQFWLTISWPASSTAPRVLLKGKEAAVATPASFFSWFVFFGLQLFCSVLLFTVASAVLLPLSAALLCFVRFMGGPQPAAALCD